MKQVERKERSTMNMNARHRPVTQRGSKAVQLVRRQGEGRRAAAAVPEPAHPQLPGSAGREPSVASAVERAKEQHRLSEDDDGLNFQLRRASTLAETNRVFASTDSRWTTRGGRPQMSLLSRANRDFPARSNSELFRCGKIGAKVDTGWANLPPGWAARPVHDAALPPQTRQDDEQDHNLGGTGGSYWPSPAVPATTTAAIGQCRPAAWAAATARATAAATVATATHQTGSRDQPPATQPAALALACVQSSASRRPRHWTGSSTPMRALTAGSGQHRVLRAPGYAACRGSTLPSTGSQVQYPGGR